MKHYLKAELIKYIETGINPQLAYNNEDGNKNRFKRLKTNEYLDYLTGLVLVYTPTVVKDKRPPFPNYTYYKRKPSLWSEILMFLRIKKRTVISYNTYDEGFRLTDNQ